MRQIISKETNLSAFDADQRQGGERSRDRRGE